MKLKNLIYISILLLTVCGQKSVPDGEKNTAEVSKDTIQAQIETPLIPQDTTAHQDEYLADKIAPIRANFKRINAKTDWTKIEKKELFESTEGGEASYYYADGTLEKVVIKTFGEMGQMTTEYYLLDGELSFVFEKTYMYNAPVYDSANFVLEKSEITEERSYFEDGKLIQCINSQDNDTPFSEEYLRETGKDLKSQFAELIQQQ
ncbi:MAG: hypothetical protein AAF740_08305 [Bacteroidota bacterium]